MRVLDLRATSGDSNSRPFKIFFYIFFFIIAPLIVVIGHFYERDLTMFIMPLFPDESDKGFPFYLDFVRLCINEFIWLSLFVLITFLLFLFFYRKNYHLSVSARGVGAAGVTLASLLITIFVAYFVLEVFPNSSDEYSYIFQARTLVSGKLWEPAPNLPDAFHFNHIAIKDGIRIGRFPPGWPLVMGLGLSLGLPVWLINPLLGALTLILFYRFAKNIHGRRIALIAVVALGFCGYFIFNAASFFSHTCCTLFVLLFTWCVYSFTGRKILPYVLAGFFISMVLLIRYFTAILVAAPVVVWIISEFRWRSVRVFAWMFVGALPCLFILLWYNNEITGDPLTPVTMWAFADEKLGFVKGHTVVKGMEHIVRRIFMFSYWASPGLLILYVIYLMRKIRSKIARWTFPADYYFILLLIGHFFYYQIGGNQYGPRFLLEGLPFLILMVVRETFAVRAKLAHALLAASIIFSVIKLPSIAEREEQVIHERKDVYDLVARENIADAVVILSSPTGVIRPMPIGDLTRNDLPDPSVVYLQDKDHDAVLRLFPNRSYYRYFRNVNEVHGKLLPIGRARSFGHLRATATTF